MYDYLMLDIGGSFVKHGAMKENELCLTGSFPIQQSSNQPGEVLAPITAFIRENPARHLCISIPGPMDYTTGTSYMKHKFKSLYGISMKDYLMQNFPRMTVRFLHDAAAFMIGEMEFGAVRNLRNAAGIMLGTGLGFVLCKQKKILLLDRRTPAYPLWNQYYENGIVEDYASARAVCNYFADKTGLVMEVVDVAKMAREGNAPAVEAFSRAGTHLGRCLSLHLKPHSVELIVAGGQISKSLDLMLPAIRKELDIPLVQAQSIDHAPLLGAYMYALKGDSLMQIEPDNYWADELVHR